MSEKAGRVIGAIEQRVDVGDIVEGAHRKAIDDLAGIDEVERFAAARWSLRAVSTPTFVLGDSVAVAVGTDGTLGQIPKFKAAATHAVYLPIDPQHVVVARFQDSGDELLDGALVRASIALARDAFYAERKDEELRAMMEHIGTARPLTESSSDEMVRDSWENLELE